MGSAARAIGVAASSLWRCLRSRYAAALVAQTSRVALDVVVAADGDAGSRSAASPPRGSTCLAPCGSPTASIFACGRSSSAARSTAPGRRRSTSWACATNGPARSACASTRASCSSPIGLSILENRPDQNPVVSQHSTLYLPLPRYEIGTPTHVPARRRYPLGAKVTCPARDGTRARPSSTVRRFAAGRSSATTNRRAWPTYGRRGIHAAHRAALRRRGGVRPLCRARKRSAIDARRSHGDAGTGRRRVVVWLHAASPGNGCGPNARWRSSMRASPAAGSKSRRR